MGFFIAWLLVICAIAALVYTKQVGDFTGTINWAEKYFGMGGTYSAIKIFALLMIFLSIYWMSGGLQSFLLINFGVFFGIT